jgi:hypothetical protein
MADDRYGIATSDLLVRGKLPAEQRIDAEQRKEVRGRRSSQDRFHVPFPSDTCGILAGHRSNVFQELTLFAEVHNLRAGDPRMLLETTQIDPDQIQPIGLVIRQRRQKHSVDHAEDGGVRPDPEGERQHNGECEARSFDELPNSEADVSQQFTHRLILSVAISHRLVVDLPFADALRHEAGREAHSLQPEPQ